MAVRYRFSRPSCGSCGGSLADVDGVRRYCDPCLLGALEEVDDLEDLLDVLDGRADS